MTHLARTKSQQSPQLNSGAHFGSGIDGRTLSAKEKMKSGQSRESIVRLAWSWLLFAPFLAVFVSSLIFFDLVQRIAICFGVRAHERSVLWLNRSLFCSLSLLLTRFEATFLCELPAEGPLIIVSNHQSLFDIPILHMTFGRFYPRFIAKKELARWLPSVSFNLRHGQNAIIDRADARQSIRAIAGLGKVLEEKKCAVVIFPEGTRARTGQLREFKHAGFSTLFKKAPHAQVIPVALDNTWKITARRFGPYAIGTRVRIVVGKPIDASSADAKAILDQAYRVIKHTLEEMRSTPHK